MKNYQQSYTLQHNRSNKSIAISILQSIPTRAAFKPRTVCFTDCIVLLSIIDLVLIAQQDRKH